jgi:molybdopterin biosynthesis enzyme
VPIVNRPDIRRLPKRGDPQEAQKKLLEAVQSKVLTSESAALADAVGRILAKDIYANINIPAYDKTFIDGYAINPQTTAEASPTKPVIFKIIGKLFPSDYPTNVQVALGETVYVATGSAIPKGAFSTVKVEETRLNGDQIEIVRPIKPGEGIIPISVYSLRLGWQKPKFSKSQLLPYCQGETN